MNYRGLFSDNTRSTFKWVYGLPNYDGKTCKISTIKEQSGAIYDIIPETLGEETEYMDKYREQIYTGDILSREDNGEIQEFIVEKTTIDQENTIINASVRDSVRVRLSGVVVLKQILPDGKEKLFLPCVDHLGIDDCRKMEITGTIYERKLLKREM